MSTRKMTKVEIDEAVQVYIDAGADPVAMGPLMDLLQEQTDFMQARFWRKVDSTR